MPSIKRNIWTVDPYVYQATSSGLNVHDLSSEALINFISFAGGVNSVWANDQYVYIATTVSGIYRSTVTTITGTSAAFNPYKTYPDITDNEVNYLHGNGDFLCASTVSGVDRYRISDGYRVSESGTDAQKCYQTSVGDYYYAVNLTDSTELHAVYSGGGGYTYTSGPENIIVSTSIADIYVTEGTSRYDAANVIFLATSSGAYVIEEKRGNEDNCEKRIYLLDT